MKPTFDNYNNENNIYDTRINVTGIHSIFQQQNINVDNGNYVIINIDVKK